MKYLLTTLTFMVVIGYTYGQKDKKFVDRTVQKENIEAHIQFLASDALKGRDTPSPEQEIAAEYLRTQLKSYGVLPFPEYPDYLQKVDLKKSGTPKEGEIQLDTLSLNFPDDMLVLMGGSFEWKGAFVLMDYANPDELEGLDLNGKIVIANCGDGKSDNARAWYRMSRRDKRNRVKASGAVGLIELYNSPQLSWQVFSGFLGRARTSLDEESEQSGFIHLWLNNANNELLPGISNLQGKEIQLSIGDRQIERFSAYNVVGYLPGSSIPDEYVVYSAHYDHVGIGSPDSEGDSIYNGARDNVIGTVTVLETAKNIGKYPTQRSSIFILFTAEEKGLLGSQWFVGNSPVPLNKMTYCFNSDNAAYNDVTKASIFGLERTTASDDLIDACSTYGLEAVGDLLPEQNIYDRSDHVNFAKAGIPALMFSTGITAFDEEIARTYHRPADEASTLDYDYLYKFFKAYVYAARLISNTKDRIFWIEGDKYYDGGVRLYGE